MSGGFLARWSRRKRWLDDTPDDAPDDASVGAPPAPLPATTAAPEPDAEPAPDLAALPSLESLTGNSDLAGFLRRGVPEDLRRAALRRVWSLDAGIRDFVGPADYAWDFNAPDGVPGFALELGSEVGELLAQAIGQVGGAPVDEAADAVAQDDEPGREPDGDAGAEPAMLAEAPPEVEEPPAPPPAAVPAPDAVPPEPRRRHGGALPG